MACKSILIFGLRRSGTTVLWETLRRDAGTVCFDEPFHPQLWAHVRQNAKGTWDELGAYWDQEKPDRATGLVPIRPLDELDASILPEQRSYLQDLIAAGDRTVIDIVRGWNKVPEIIPDQSQALVVHLVRPPADWVSAHMLPSGDGTWKKVLADRYRRYAFFTRTGFYNNWQYEEIIDAALRRDHPMWRSIRLSPDALAREPAYVKLLALWWAANLITYQRLKTWTRGPVRTLVQSDFTADPAAEVLALYEAAGWPMPDGGLGYEHVRRTRPAWQAASRHWSAAADRLGLPPTMLVPGQFSLAMAKELFENRGPHVS